MENSEHAKPQTNFLMNSYTHLSNLKMVGAKTMAKFCELIWLNSSFLATLALEN